jgi:hypothetical protein
MLTHETDRELIELACRDGKMTPAQRDELLAGMARADARRQRAGLVADPDFRPTASATERPDVAGRGLLPSTETRDMLEHEIAALVDGAISVGKFASTQRAALFAVGRINGGELKRLVDATPVAAISTSERSARETLEDELVALVDAAIADGKAAATQRVFLLAMGRNDPQALRAFLGAIPAATLNDVEYEMARRMGMDPAKVLESKKAAIRDGRVPHADRVYSPPAAPPSPTKGNEYNDGTPSEFRRTGY